MVSTSRFVTFKERLHTLRVLHAVTQSSQRIFVFGFTSMFQGDLNDIVNSLQMKLGSNERYKRSFTKSERDRLEAGDYKKWNIPLLFKLIQKACGLQYPIGNQDEETLENHLHQLKEWQADLSRNFDLVLTKEQMESSLEDLRNLTATILVTMSEKVQLNQDDAKRLSDMVDYIIKDVKQAVIEKKPTGGTNPDWISPQV